MDGSCLKLTSASDTVRWHPRLTARKVRTAGLLCASTIPSDELIGVLSLPKVEGVVRSEDFGSNVD